jgi:membrane protease YdiL (CAAX protease family)
MGQILILVAIFWVFYLDTRALKKRAPRIYEETIGKSPQFWSLLALFLFFLVGPIYLYKRYKYFKLLKREASQTCEELKRDTERFNLFTECTGVLLVWYTGIIILALLYAASSIFFPFLREVLLQYVILSLFSNLLFIFLIVRARTKNKNEVFFEWIHLKKGKSFFTRSIFIPFLLGAALAATNYFFLSLRAASPETPLTIALSEGTPLALLLFLTAAIITAPLFEEIIYRGYLYSVFRTFKGRIFTIFFIALLFCVVHIDQLWGDPLAIVLIFIMGLSVTLLRALTGSIFPGIVAHYSYNVLTLVIPLLFLFISNTHFYTAYFFGDYISKEKEIVLLERSINEKPEFAESYNALAWIYAEQGEKLDEALFLIEKALSFLPDDPAFLDTKAEVLYKLGRIDESIAIEESLIARFANEPFFKEQRDKFKEQKDNREM